MMKKENATRYAPTSYIEVFDSFVTELLHRESAPIQVEQLFGDTDWWLSREAHPQGTPDELLFEIIRQNLINVDTERSKLKSRHRNHPQFANVCVRLIDQILVFAGGFLSRRQKAFVCNAKATALRGVAYADPRRVDYDAARMSVAWYNAALNHFEGLPAAEFRRRHIHWLCGCLRFDTEGSVDGVRQASLGVAGNPLESTIGIYFGFATRLFMLERADQLEILASLEGDLLHAYGCLPSADASGKDAEHTLAVSHDDRMTRALVRAGIASNENTAQGEPEESITISSWSSRLLDRFAVCVMLASSDRFGAGSLFAREVDFLLPAVSKRSSYVGLSPEGVKAAMDESRRVASRSFVFERVPVDIDPVKVEARQAARERGVAAGLEILRPHIEDLEQQTDVDSTRRLVVLLHERVFIQQEGGNELHIGSGLERATQLAVSIQDPLLVLRCNFQASRLFRTEQSQKEQQRCFDVWWSICAVLGTPFFDEGYFPVGTKGGYAPDVDNRLLPPDVPDLIRNLPAEVPDERRISAYRLFRYLSEVKGREQENRVASVNACFERNPDAAELFPIFGAIPPSRGIMGLLAQGDGDFADLCRRNMVPILCQQLGAAQFVERRSTILGILGKLVPKYMKDGGVPPDDLLWVSHFTKTGGLEGIDEQDAETGPDPGASMGFDAFREMLSRGNSCVLDYHVGSQGSTLLLWSATGVQHFELNVGIDDIDRHLRRVNNLHGSETRQVRAQGLADIDRYLRDSGTADEKAERCHTAMKGWHRLSTVLLPPNVQSELASYDKIFVSPSAALSRVSIHMLSLNGQPLLSQKPIIYVQSPLHAMWPNTTARSDGDWYGLAVPEGDEVLKSLDLKNQWGIPQTPEERLRGIGSSDSALLICHGINQKQSMNNRLCFARGSRLTNRDLAPSCCPPLSGQGILLLACHSAHSNRHAPGGSIAHNLLKVGAGTVLGCLWAVGTESAKAFVTQVATNAKEGHPLPEAYRQAYISLAEKEPTEFMKVLIGAPYVMMG